MKINIGSNTIKHKGFLNVDIRNVKGVDIVDDVMVLKEIKNDSCEAIIAHNILEHVAYDKSLNVLKLWVNKLKVGGWIEIGVPNGELIFERHKKGIITRKEYKDCPWMNVIHSIFGNLKIMRKMHGDDAEKYMHNTLFCRSFLVGYMEEAGLHKILERKPNHPDCMTFRGWKK